MRIRQVLPTDRDAIVQLIKEFFLEELVDRGLTFDMERCYRDFDLWINLEQTIALCIERDGFIDGVICAVLVERPFFGELTAQELIWYVRKSARKHGMKLMKAVETVSETRGCKSIAMVALSDSKVEKLYKHFGYTKHESCWLKFL